MARVSQQLLGQYLLILDFPSDVQEALSGGRVNLQEAAQHARLTPERLGCTHAEAHRTSYELLQAHTAVQAHRRAYAHELKICSAKPRALQSLRRAWPR
jgi:hypothetical protein